MEGMNQILPLNGEMNQDNDPKYIRSSDGQVIERINLRPNSIDGKRWSNEKIIGNLLITKDKWSQTPFSLPVGDNKTIGEIKDYQNSAIIYCVYNSLGWHSILRYYQKTKEIEKIWYARPTLDFQDSIIKGCIADGSLYFVNKGTHPKSFVIDKAVNYTNGTTIGDGTAYSGDDSPLDEVILPLIKKPPRFAPKDCTYQQDANYNFNNLRKKLFQFKYCYQYDNFQRSSWSAISKVPLPLNEVKGNGEWETDITVNNYISLRINTGEHSVRKILVAAREANPTNSGSFFIFEEIDKTLLDIEDNEDYFVNFYNTKRTESINTDVDNRYFDDVPLDAEDIIILDNKYLVLANPTKGYPGIDPDYTLTYSEEAITFDNPFIEMKEGCEFKKVYAQGLNIAWANVQTIYIPTQFYPNAIYNITFQFQGQAYNKSFATGAVQTEDYPTDMRNNFLNDIRNEFWPLFADNVDGGDYNGIQFEIEPETIPTNYVCEAIENISGKVFLEADTYYPVYKSIKRGQFHPFGIIYNDGYNRYNIVFANEELYSPLVGATAGDERKRVLCNWAINHAPPADAVTYRWCYIRNKTYTYFLYVLNAEITLGTGTNEGNNGIPTGKYFLKINQTLEEIRELYPNFIIPDYLWQNGDRVRVIGSADSYELLMEWTVISEVEGTDDTIGFLVDADLSTGTGFIPILEVYRQNPEPQDNIYLEIGEEFEISTDVNGNRIHKGQTTDQLFGANGSLVTAATGTFDFGDVYFRLRYGDDGILQPVEDANFSDYYISDSIDVGRAGAKIKSEQKELNSVVRSENFLENTEYNLLNVFLPETVHFDASEIYGRITAIIEMGGTLKVFQGHKENSIMIGQVTEKQAEFGDWIMLNDSVFGALRRYEEDRGSTYRRSIAANNRWIYYFDESTAEFIRSSANGQAPISKEYNMQNWFEKKAKELREYTGEKDVIVSFDNDYEDVLVSFKLGNTNETIVFSEKEGFKGWLYFVDYHNDTDAPESFVNFKDTLVSFMNGQLYLHGAGENNTFYGKLFGCSIKTEVNQYASMVKRYSSIKINSDRNLWSVSFDIPLGLNYPVQKSILIPGIIREQENVLYSDILRNIINRAGVEDRTLIHVGTQLVGEFMEVTLSDETSQDVNLSSVQVNFLIAK